MGTPVSCAPVCALHRIATYRIAIAANLLAALIVRNGDLIDRIC